VSPVVREPVVEKFESHHCFQHSSRISSDSVKNLFSISHPSNRINMRTRASV